MSVQPGKNPFRPGASTPPLYLAGREPQLQRFPKILSAAPEIPANVRLTGLRGVGKSVLLREYEELAKKAGWATSRIQLEPRHNTEEALALLVSELASKAQATMSRGAKIRASIAKTVDAGRRLIAVSYEDLTFSVGGATLAEANIGRNLYDTVEAALDTGHEGYALLLDEAQVLRDDLSTKSDSQHPLSMLIAAVNALQSEQIPIVLVLCGLPSLRAHIQRARTYSERMFRGDMISELSGNPGPARDAFVRPLEGSNIHVDEALIARVLEEVEGYPFFIQLWGAELWDAATAAGVDRFSIDLLDAIEPDIYSRLDDEFYAGRVETLTPSEQDLLVSFAKCQYPPLKSPDITAHSNRTGGNVNVLMGRLVEQGVLYRLSKGVYEYTAPKFHQYLQRRTSSSV